MEDESEFTSRFTCDFVNEEPIVFKGLTDGEVKTVFLLSLVCGAPVGVFLGLLSGMPMLVLVFVLVIPIVVVWFIAGWMEKARRGKPPGYVEQKMHIYMTEKKLMSAEFVFISCRWGLGRTDKGRGGDE